MMFRLVDLLADEVGAVWLRMGVRVGAGGFNAGTLATLSLLILPAVNPAGNESVVPYRGHLNLDAVICIFPLTS